MFLAGWSKGEGNLFVIMRKVKLNSTHFSILGVTPNSTKVEIKKAYLEQVKIWHPDVNSANVDNATDKMKIINEAYELLKDYDGLLGDSKKIPNRPNNSESRKSNQGKSTNPKGVKLDIARKPVKSSNVVSIGYDDSSKVLQVEFYGRSIYQYYNVPAFIYFELMQSISKGKYLNQKVFGFFRYEAF